MSVLIIFDLLFMGFKGDKEGADAGINAEILLEKLIGLGDISAKKMFGGYGIMESGKMFGMINPKGIAFLKVDEALKDELVKIGSEPHSKMPYSSIPEELFNDTDQLREWAKKSIELIVR